jgi:hypothetical protein
MAKFKLRTALLSVAILTIVFSAGAQDQKLNLSGERMSVSGILMQIRQQAHLGVAYRTDQIDPDRVIALPSRELSLEQVMALIAEGTDTKGVIDGNMVVFVKKDPAPVPVAADGFVPTPLSQFRESLGLRPRSVIIEGETAPSEQIVELPMPMESNLLPLSGYTSNQRLLPRWALKTNVPYWLAGKFTPNLSVEFGLGKKTTLESGGSYNWLGRKRTGEDDDNKKMLHMIIKPEFRYWLCERFDGHFFGVHALYTRYNIDGYRVPLLFDRQYRYDGYGIGGGITYGYHWAITKGFGLEFAVGAGVVRMNYDRFECGGCQRDGEPMKKTYFGPTNAAINLVFLIK